MRAGLRPTAKALDKPPDSKVRAPVLYPTALIAVNVINRMSALGMPESVKIVA